MSHDPDPGPVYLSTGNATPDFWAAHQTEEDAKWSSSIVAVSVATGRPVWHFQTGPHDLWDFNMPAQPVLYDIPNGDGTATPAVVTVSKTGMIYLPDRRDGKPLADIVERPMPQGHVEGQPCPDPALFQRHAGDRQCDLARIRHVGRHAL